MHRIGADSDESDFLVMYEDMLNVGRQYKLTVWVTGDKNGSSVDLSLVHENWPDVFDTDSGVEFIKTVTLQDGVWQKLEYTFVANTKWIAIRTSGNVSVYFDDIMLTQLSDTVYPVNNISNSDKNKRPNDSDGQVIDSDSDEDTEPTDDSVQNTKKPRKKKKKILIQVNESNIIVPIAVISGVVVAAALVIVIIVLKRRKSKKQTKAL